MCIKMVGRMKCPKCNEVCIKNGIRNNSQRYYCKICRFSHQENYTNNSCIVKDCEIITLVKEGCGIRSVSRILNNLNYVKWCKLF